VSEPRTRTAQRAEQSSDVTRFRGVLAGAIASGIAVVIIAAVALGADGLRSPGPLTSSHDQLECASCHTEGAAEPACGSCHEGQSSARPGHAALEVSCAACHRGHGDQAISFTTDGTLTLPNGQRERTAFRPVRPVRVAVVRGEACTACHDASAPRDPVSRCFAPSGDVVCSGEHSSGHAAAWEAARIALARPREARATSLVGSLWGPLAWVLFAGLAGGVALALVKRARREKPAPRGTVSLPVIADKVRLPTIDTTTCLGCYACVDACPYDVIAIEKFVAVVVKPKDCCGLTLCEQVCPNGSLKITDGEPIEDRPRVSEALESLDTPGLYVAGDLTGAPLIKNAIRQGALAARTIAESVPRGSDLDLLIVGAGPAGISAALEAKARGLRYEVLEQGSVAESIRSFPRGKLVFDQPLSMPIEGELWLAESTKEELLAKWTRIVRREQLRIREGHRVTAVERGEVFVVRAIDPEGAEISLRAKRVLLALGRRGTPRKLEVAIPDGALDRVHYSLADARSHAGARTIVIGLGDVAMEAAIALASQESTRVALVHRGSSFARGKARNVAEVERLVQSGRIELLLDTSVRELGEREITVQTASGARTLAYDALFVMIGSLPPWPFLEAAGVKRVRSAPG
jgi:thioredoxin reductase/NAD-dependent dihydropyrimidine dehydrogenase PreA subunit